MRKRIFVWLVMALVLTGVGAVSVSATQLGGGLKEPEVYDVPENEIEPVVEIPDRETGAGGEETELADWNIYANHYYYNQLSPQLQNAWDQLNVICDTYYAKTKDVSNYYTNPSSGKVTGYMEWITLSEPMTKAELKVFWEIYVYSNPQYYFLSNSYMRSGSGINAEGENTYTKMAMVVYESFWKGEDRWLATEKVKQQLDVWQQQIDMCSTDAQKVKMIQDLICAKVTYNKEAANDQIAEGISFSQSVYSVLCGESTVCAGYADTFYMLCNASGIDAISVTSPGHQWNKARINGAWYNFDATWDDTYSESKGYPLYFYHGRSDAMYDTDVGFHNISNIENHQEEAFWDGYIPACNLDTNPTGICDAPGTFAEPMGQAAMPQILVSCEDGELQVTLWCDTENAVLYYTTDGSNPAVSDKKTLKYTGSFFAETDMKIKAVAVCDGYTDSGIAEKTIEWEKYVITYVLNGGKNHAENPDRYTSKDEICFQAASAEKGYLFDGWYLDEAYTQELKKIAKGSRGAVTLYAKWKPVTYEINYRPNAAVTGTMPATMLCLYNEEYTLSPNMYKVTGYTFTGWNTGADGSGTAYADKASVKNLADTEGAVITLYAQWRANAYTIVFDGNKAKTGSMEDLSSLLYGKSYVLSKNNYKRIGYRFGGWNTAKNGKGISYKDKAQIQNLSSQDGGVVTLYAQWNANKYTVKFHGNGATSGSMKKMKNRTYDKKFRLSANKFKKEGYKFVGWNTKKNGKGKMYKNKAKVKNLTSKNGKTVTLYAQWKKIKK